VIHKLENEFTSATIKSLGAELSSFILKETGREYMWQADPAFWDRHSPLLFPIVGRLKNNTYRVGTTEYSLPQHGFTRDMEFTLVDSSATHCVFRLSSNSQTLAQYPYPFELDVCYTLEAQTLVVEYRVKNTSEQKMYFSIGAHPGFNCPDLLDYVLEFSEPETLPRLLVSDGLIGDAVPFLENENMIALSPEYFREDAIVLPQPKSEFITLRNTKSDHYTTMGIAGFPYLLIWSLPTGAPFVCLEPWYGIADRIGADPDFTKKEGIQVLDGLEMGRYQHTITIG